MKYRVFYYVDEDMLEFKSIGEFQIGKFISEHDIYYLTDWFGDVIIDNRKRDKKNDKKRIL